MTTSPWKERIETWDVPSEDNDIVAEKFLYGVFDDTGLKIPYRLFVPEGMTPGEKYPLSLFLHGADVTGNDNNIHIAAHDIGTVFAREEWQKKHPGFVLAPQYKSGKHWTRKEIYDSLVLLIKKLIKTYGSIDSERILIYGYSAGGIGSLKLLKEYPDLFRKAIIMCGATEEDDICKLKKTPLWLFHAEDDGIVRCFGSESNGFFPAHLGSDEIYERLKDDMGDNIKYTRYKAGALIEEYGVDPHCAWVPVSKDTEAKEWFFS